MKVTISLRAEADIEDVTDYIAADNPFAAHRLNERLYAAIFAITPYPARFSVAEGLESAGIRRCGVGAYSIFYVVQADDVLVLRVIHGKRDYPKLFRD